jgi:hypothetical protein
MLYEMLAGTVPFQADTTFGMLMKQINEPPPPIKGISPDLQALLDRALAKNPALRYESAGDLADEFMALFNGQTISPGTLHIAEMARQAAEASQQAKKQPEERPSRRWVRIAIEVAVLLILGLAIYRVLDPNRQTAVAPNVPVGRARFDDSNFFMDNISVSLNNSVPQPEDGMHYEAWLLGEEGVPPRDIGRLIQGDSGVWRLDFDEPSQGNLLRTYNQIQITKEQDGVAISAPTGEVVYSSIYPPVALESLRHLIVAHEQTPDGGPLIQNLWYYSGEYLNKSISGDQFEQEYIGMVQALATNDEPSLRTRTEEVINQIVGSLSDQYQDYDKDGAISVSGDEYGSLPQGEERLGYIQESALYAQSTADAPDSTVNIRGYNDDVQVCLQNMEGWTNEILRLALQLNETSFGPEMEPIVSELKVLGNQLVHGVDVNQNGIIDAVAGECGADTAYFHSYYMADFQIYPGADRTPPTGKE